MFKIKKFDAKFILNVAYSSLSNELITSNLNSLENLFLTLGMNWTSSKFMPFVTILMASLVLFFQIQKLIKSKLALKIFVFLAVSFVPVTTYFLFFPVYHGDLINSGSTIRTKIEFSSKKKLVVFALPDCPYCHETKFILEKLLERNPKLEIEIWLTGDQPDSYYNSIRSKRIEIIHNEQFDNTIYLTKGIFPTFVITNNNRLIKRWTNQSFGTRGLDEIEQFFEVYN